MAMIICPECKKEVSDMASTCPNCGYPINSNKKFKVIINEYSDTDTCALAGINQTFGEDLSYDEGMNIFNNCPYNIIDCDTKEEAINYAVQLKKWSILVDVLDNDNNTVFIDASKPRCPKCGSTKIQIVPRKWSLLTGLLTNKVDRVCLKCKCKF